MFSPSLVLSYSGRVHHVSAAGTGSKPAPVLRTLDHCAVEAQKAFELPPGTYDLEDRFGRIEYPEDLQRALDTAGDGECIIEIKEHLQFIKLRDLDNHNTSQDDRMTRIEEMLRASEERQNKALEESHDELFQYIQRVESRMNDEIDPVVQELCRDRDQLQKDLRKAQEKLRQINIRELREMKEGFELLREEMKANIKRVDRIDTLWTTQMQRIDADIERLTAELKELHRYMQGKIEVLIQADAEIAHDQQRSDERLSLLQSDVSLLRENHKELNDDYHGSKKSVEEVNEIMKEVKANNDTLMVHGGHFRTRIHVLEFFAMEKWNAFFPGVTYFRHWHRDAKGEDVQHSKDLSVAIGRSNTASTGLTLKTTDGLTVANGVCRRFGKDKYWSSYFEVEIDEVKAAPDGAGGLYAGFSVNSPEEIVEHPHHQFNGWFIGGKETAMVCRSGRPDNEFEDFRPEGFPENLPHTWAPGQEVCETAFESVQDNVETLRAALPPLKQGTFREIPSYWNCEELIIGDLVGVMIRFKEEGGCRLRVHVNGQIIGTHDFLDAPPEEAIGFLYPAVRLSGRTKSVRLKRNMVPPEGLLVDW